MKPFGRFVDRGFLAAVAPLSTAMRAAAMATLLATGSALGDEGWSYRVTPYAWAPSMRLATGAFGGLPETDTETDLLEILDFAALVAGEARKDDWGVLFEVNYLDLSKKKSRARGLIETKTEMSGVMAGLAASRRLVETPNARANVFAGFRYWSLDTMIDLQRLNDRSWRESFVDPIIGLRGEYDLSPCWFVSSLAEVGGFGVGDGSDLQWELMGRLAYRHSESTAFAIGYRHLGLHFERGGRAVDATLTGPLIALDITW